MSGKLEQGSGAERPDDLEEELVFETSEADVVPDDAEGTVSPLRARVGHAFERATAFIGRQPRPLMASLAVACVLTVLGVVFSQSLTASLRAALPERVAGIVGASEDHEGGATRIWTGSAGRAAPAGQRFALRDAGDTQADYLPQPKLGDLGTAATVITVPVSQGRLLRFDDAVESVFIADPSIADIRMVSSDLVYIYGKKLGLTNLMAVSPRGTQGEGTRQRQG